MADSDGSWLVFTDRARGENKSIDHNSRLRIKSANNTITFYYNGEEQTEIITFDQTGKEFRRERSDGEEGARIGGFIWQSNGGWLMTGYVGWGTGPGGPNDDEHDPKGDDNTDTFTAVKTSG